MSSDDDILLHMQDAAKSYPMARRPVQQLWAHLRGAHDRPGQRYALHPVNLALRAGESVGIVGLNGAGKSTLLQMAAGVLPPSSGTVRIRGRVAALLELGSGFNPEATGLQNIYLYAATLGLARVHIEQRLDAIVAFSGLKEFLHAPVKTYSTGMQVRLAFSVATSVDPDILIVDEALSVGDGVFAKRSFDRIMQLRDQGTALLLCSHALFHVDQFCQRTLWLDQGRVRAWGATKQVLPQYQEFLDAATTAADAGSPAQTGQVPAGAADADAPTPADGAHQPFQSAQRPELVRLLSATIALDGQTGPELYGLAHSSLLEVTIALQTSAEEPHPRAAIVISSDSGRIIGTHITPPAWIHATDPAGHCRIRYQLPQLPLNEGRYRVGVYLLCHQARYVYDWSDPHGHIHIGHQGAHQGPWLMPGHWVQA